MSSHDANDTTSRQTQAEASSTTIIVDLQFLKTTLDFPFNAAFLDSLC
jgi:hypothetical protein